MDTVSVIIPTWNRASILKKAMDSVLNQTIPVTELFICDDGSTDNTRDVVLSYKDDRIKYIDCGRNGHPSIPRNFGITQSTGEWLALLDSDDVWHPEKLKKQLTLLKGTGGKACCTNANRISPQGINQGLLIDYKKPKMTLDDLLTTNFVVCSSMLFHRTLLEKIGGFPEQPNMKGVEDYALWLRIASLQPIEYLNEPLVNYSDDANNSVRGEVTSNVYLQRMVLLKDYAGWAGASAAQIKKAKRLMRMSGVLYIASRTKGEMKRIIRKNMGIEK